MTNESNQAAQEREAFEKFVSDQGVAANYLGDGQYGFGVQLAWQAWQARAALVAPAQLTDDDILQMLATHGIGYVIVGSKSDGETVPFCGEDAETYVKAIRAVLVAAQGNSHE